MEKLTILLTICALIYGGFLFLTLKTLWRDTFSKKSILIPVKSGKRKGDIWNGTK
ncbi:hypothetical protein [Pseudozobellia thermophila]|uniref:Uncharacterized protein n=1 Tax=Pseudozobellia thermophila TaxID=192903 RepID=A0A1M6BPJ4_9FLAO|nr:hypothetical protein [Pseudozobellia thermophila]SHI50468.1 hypothetical protein SAMN04488513_101487 [Pseudozobellia thermophila]